MGKQKISPGFAVRLTVVSVMGILVLLPLYWMVTGSFKVMKATMTVPPEIFPKNPTLENYAFIFGGHFPAFRWLFNSALVSVSATFLALLICTMLGYAFAKKQFYGKNVLFVLVLVTMMLPRQSVLIPLFQMVKHLGLLNTFVGAIVPIIVWPYGVFMMRQFIAPLPNELIESATIDGASELRIFRQIILPLSAPALSALGVIMFMNSWNDFMWQSVVLREVESWTINVGVATLAKNTIGGSNTINYGYAMAGGVVGALPVTLIFFALQKYFVKGLTMGAVKG